MKVITLTFMRSPVLWGVLFILFVAVTPGQSQNNVAIGSSTTKASAVLWLKASGTQGFLLPAVANRTAFTGLNSSDEKGMMIFDLSDNKVYYWNGSAWVAASGGSGGGTEQTLTLNGNTFTLSGTAPSNVSLAFGTPQNGQALVWNQTQSRWEAVTAAGDITGVYGNLSVTKLKGKDLPASLPSSTQALVYNGTAWAFQAIGGTDSQTLNLAGNQLSITGGNSITLPDVSATNEIQNLSTGGTGTAAAGESFDILLSSGTGVKIKEGTNVQIDQASNVLTINSSAGGGGITTVTASPPLSVGTPTTTPAISITQATTSTNGYLSTTDWNTFNNKLGATVLTAGGDLLFHNGTTTTRLPRGNNGDVLLSTTTGIQWSALSGGGDMLKATYDANADNIVDAAATVNYGSQAINTFFAAPSASAGTPTFRTIAPVDVPGLDVAKITSGTFGITRGGTGIATTPATNQILIGNGAGYALSTLTQGSGVTITNSAGLLTISSTGLSNPLTTTGDIIYGVGTTPTRLPGAAGFLKSTGAAAPAWAAVNLASGDVTSTLPASKGGTGLTSAPSSGQVLTGDGTNYSLATLTSGTGVNVTTGAGTITIAATPQFSTPNKIPKGDVTGLVSSVMTELNSNIGIGDANPQASLTIARGTGVNGTLMIAGTGGYSTHFNYSTAENTYIRAGKAGAYVTINDSHNGNVYLVDGGGKVAVDVATPLAKLHASEPNSAGNGLYGENTFSGTTGGTGVTGVATNNPGYGTGGKFTGGNTGAYGSANATSFTGVAYGIYGVATGTAGTRYGVYGEATGGATNYAGYFNGNVFTTGSYLPSDEKLKHGIHSYDDRSVELLKKIDIKRYYYHHEGDFKNMVLPEGEQVGLLAGDLEKVFPQLVTAAVQNLNTGEDRDKAENILHFKAVNYAGLVPYLVKAIQEQQRDIETLQLRVKELEEKTKKVDEVFAQLEEMKKEMDAYRSILGAQAKRD